ncbi:MAG: TIGR01777 family oxidoreductase [Thermodesulfobacteriota bacterium]|nr:TIGR01777 family oxidoreductase [Thermodesulfobacteriota bacterium]
MVFITSSAIGFYGNGRKTCFTETADPGDLFISRVCSQWEKAAKPAEKAGIRLVTLRTGVVLSPSGGALKKMAPAFKAGLGTVIGRGRQYISWISMDDLLYAIHHILENRTIKGPVNLTAPVPVTNHEFSKQLGHVFSKPVFLFLPRIIVTSIWGRMGQETLLTSARVKPEKLLNSGFNFRHKTLPARFSMCWADNPSNGCRYLFSTNVHALTGTTKHESF